MTRVHVVGAGLAGLSAALALTQAGRAVELYESAPQAGGRCRSYFDEHLGRTIDNGGHLLMGACRATFAYLDAIGGRPHLREVAPAAYPMLDLRSGDQWTLRPNASRLPWWVFSPGRRVPGTRTCDYLAALRLLSARETDTVAARLDRASPLYERLWDPLVIAVMNAHPDEAAARPMARVLREVFGGGEQAARPWVARDGLSRAFVDPALRSLAESGVALKTGWRLSALDLDGTCVRALAFGDRRIDLAPGDAVVLAVSRPSAAALLPGIAEPDGYRAIVNAHFRLEGQVVLPGGQPLLGLIGGFAQWLIGHADIVSVTVSAADAVVDRPATELAGRLWSDVARALALPPAPMPPVRVIKEKRATLAQTPAAMRARPSARTPWRNLALAGDWTKTGLPATIEGAIRSGRAAAAVV